MLMSGRKMQPERNELATVTAASFPAAAKASTINPVVVVLTDHVPGAARHSFLSVNIKGEKGPLVTVSHKLG